MKDLLKRLKAILKEPIEGYNAMLNFYLDDVLDYYGNVITTPDNIEDFRLLIKEQSYLIEIQQIIYFNNKYNKANKSISYKMSLIQDMINNYDDIMKKSFEMFSKEEKLSFISKDKNMSNVYNYIVNNNNDIISLIDIKNEIKNRKVDKILRILNNLKLIEYDGFIIEKVDLYDYKLKQKKKES